MVEQVLDDLEAAPQQGYTTTDIQACESAYEETVLGWERKAPAVVIEGCWLLSHGSHKVLMYTDTPKEGATFEQTAQEEASC